MKNKLKFLMIAIGIIAIANPSIYAKTTFNFRFTQVNEKYIILLDGQSYNIPDKMEYSKGDTIDLTNFKENIANNASKVSSIDYENGKLTYNGSLTLTTITNEYVPMISSTGILTPSNDTQTLTNNFKKYHLLNIRKNEKTAYENAILGTTDEDLLKEYNLRVKHYTEDIEEMENLNVESVSKRVVSSIPYLSVKYSKEDIVDISSGTISSLIDADYYVYSIIFRDLRILSMKYSINSGTYTYVPDFDKDTYTYTVKLADSVPDDATITTSSLGYMDAILKANDMTEYDLGLELEDVTIKLENGEGVAKVKNIFKIEETYGGYIDENYTSDPERVYTIRFTKKDYIKGDLDRNGVVNANDAAVALDLYKYNNATDEDIQIGDIDENGVNNANDAALILDIYKYGK